MFVFKNKNMIRPKDYPPIKIDFSQFCKELISCFTKNVFDKTELNDFYITYKEHQYKSSLKWVNENGYESVKEWAKTFFQEWNNNEHRTMLKCFAPKLGKWFNSDEIKPEAHTLVLIFVPEQDDSIFTGTWEKREEWVEYYGGTLIQEKVTHWMKLPEKPKI